MAKQGYRDAVCSQVVRLLREERGRQGVSMTRLAEQAGLSQGMISLFERGLRNPSLDTLLRLCSALNLDLSSVLIQAERAAIKSK